MKLKRIEGHFVATGSSEEMVRQGLKDIPRAAGFRYSPKGASPFPAYALWWTDSKAKARKLIGYATDKAKKALEVSKKGSITWKGALQVKWVQREESVLAENNWFDVLCRDMGITVRNDFSTDEAYTKARIESGDVIA